MTASGSVGDTTITLSYLRETPPYQATDTENVTVVDVDLSASNLYGTVSEANEENPGGYVHYNVDNDNGNTSGGQPIADYTEDSVTGENDLKLLTITLTPQRSADRFGSTDTQQQHHQGLVQRSQGRLIQGALRHFLKDLEPGRHEPAE